MGVLGQETGTITGDGCARSGDYPSISWWAQAAQSGEYYDRTGVLAEYGF